MEEATAKRALEEGVSRWARSHGCKRRKLTANCASDVGVQVVALERSNFGANYYLRYGICLKPTRGFVQEPDCEIRIPVEGPWGAQPAIRLEDQPAAEDVARLLERFIEPLMRRTKTTSDLNALYAEGGLRGAAVLKEVRETMGWLVGN